MMIVIDPNPAFRFVSSDVGVAMLLHIVLFLKATQPEKPKRGRRRRKPTPTAVAKGS